MGRFNDNGVRAFLFALIGLSTVTAAACGGNADSSPRVALGEAQAAPVAAPAAVPQPVGDTVSAALSLRARAALDSGNAQMRAKRYEDALASYRLAVKEAPGHAAPEFGVYMAALRLGNTALADSAQRIISAHTGGSPTWTDSAMRSAHAERALPKSHPKF